MHAREVLTLSILGRLWATGLRAQRSGSDGARLGSASAMASDNVVSDLWRASWAQLRACHPDLEIRLAALSKARPTRARALQRLEASAGRSAGRVLRGEAKPAALLTKLWAWEAAVLAELERECA